MFVQSMSMFGKFGSMPTKKWFASVKYLISFLERSVLKVDQFMLLFTFSIQVVQPCFEAILEVGQRLVFCVKNTPLEWNSYPPAHVPLEETPELFKELAITMLYVYIYIDIYML